MCGTDVAWAAPSSAALCRPRNGLMRRPDYRFLRFFADGRVLSLVSTSPARRQRLDSADIAQPSEVVGRLQWSLRVKGVMRGRWRLALDGSVRCWALEGALSPRSASLTSQTRRCRKSRASTRSRWTAGSGARRAGGRTSSSSSPWPRARAAPARSSRSTWRTSTRARSTSVRSARSSRR